MAALGIVVKPLPKKADSGAEDEEDVQADVDTEQLEETAAKDPGVTEDIDGDGDMTMTGDQSSTAVKADTLDPESGSSDVKEKGTTPTPITPVLPATSTSETEPGTHIPTSTEMMEELIRDLLAFQETFSASANGLISPMPPPIPTFEPALPIPTSTVDEPPEVETDEILVPPPPLAIESDVAVDKTALTNSESNKDDTVLSNSELTAPEPETVQNEPPLSESLPPTSEIQTDTNDNPKANPDPDLDAGFGMELDSVLDQMPAEMALDVYREGQVGKVVTGPEEQGVLDDPASATATATVPIPAPTPTPGHRDELEPAASTSGDIKEGGEPTDAMQVNPEADIENRQDQGLESLPETTSLNETGAENGDIVSLKISPPEPEEIIPSTTEEISSENASATTTI